MSTHLRWLRTGLPVAGATLLSYAPASGQVFHLGAWDGSLEGVGVFAHVDSTTGAQRLRSEDRRGEERLNVRNTGAYLIDPRLLTLTLGGSFGLFQDELTVDHEATSGNGTLLGYDTFAALLTDQPYSLDLFASRNDSFVSRELAGQSEIVSERRGATLRARQLYVPSTLTFRQELLDETSRIGDIIARRNEDRRIVTYRGQRGWVDSEMDALYEFIDNSDRVFPTLSFDSHEGQLNYSLDFGEELNRRWDSRLRYYSRTGFSELTSWNAEESLRIDHTERLRSDYRYLFVRTETRDGANTTHTAFATLQHRLYESLTTTGRLEAVRQILPQGERDIYRGRMDLLYVKNVPLGGRLTAAVGTSLAEEDDRFKPTEASIVQESHTVATPFALPIDLGNTFVIASSIVVTKTSAGPIGCIAPPPPPPPLRLVLGVDFALRTIKNITQIVPIPCAGTTVGINPGDAIAVDYRFSVNPSLAFGTATWYANVGLDYRWLRLFASHEQVGQEVLSGRDGSFLNDEQSDSVGAELRYDSFLLRASLLGEARRFRSTRVNYDSLRESGVTDFKILDDLSLRVSADHIVTDYRDQRRQTTTEAVRAALTYVPAARLFVSVTGGVRRFEDTLQPTEQVTEAQLLVRWFFRKFEIAPRFEFLDHQRGPTTTTEYRAEVRTIRRF